MSCVPVRWLSKRISIQHLWPLVVLAGVFIFVNTHPIRPHDFWWHITIGREILASGQIPKTDIYSYTVTGASYPSYQIYWLMEVTLYLIFRAGGAALIVFVQSLILTSTILLILLTGWQLTKNWRAAAFGAGFAAILGMNAWNVRPQVITFLLGALFLFLIQQLQNGARWGWAILFPLGMLVWANSHGTFPLGLVFIGLWVGQQAWNLFSARWYGGGAGNIRHLLFAGAVGIVTSLSCLLNPRGFKILEYLQSLGGNVIVRSLVVEWAPPGFDTINGRLFIGGLLLTAIIMAVSPRRPTFYQIAAFLGMALLGLQTSRGIAWFGLVMGPVVAEHSLVILNSINKTDRTERGSGGSPVINIIFTGVVLTFVLISLPWFKERLPFPQAKAGLISMETPVEATNFILDTHPPGNIFHAISFGSYLIWAAYPEYRVFVDGRIELYPAEVWQDYLEISNAKGDWDSLLQQYGINVLMLSPNEQAVLVTAILGSANWELVYEDQAALVFFSR
jgi:hypothetical protein